LFLFISLSPVVHRLPEIICFLRKVVGGSTSLITGGLSPFFGFIPGFTGPLGVLYRQPLRPFPGLTGNFEPACSVFCLFTFVRNTDGPTGL